MNNCPVCGTQNRPENKNCSSCNFEFGTDFGAHKTQPVSEITEDISSGSMAAEPYLVEKKISKYKIIEEIGRGGMGVVYKGQHETLERYVAVKTLPARLSLDETCLKRFKDEAEILAKLHHKNIVSIYDIEKQNGVNYLIMEFVQGKTVSQLIKEHGPFSPDRAANIALDVALALEHSHSKGVIHRDIHPGNIIIDNNGNVKVTDFGIARATEKDSRTKSGIIGTPRYLAPERIKSNVTDRRSDIYSIGIVFYEMLTGQTPFDDESDYRILEKHMKEKPEKPSAVRQGVPPEFERIILKCLEKKRDDRYSNCGELAALLKKVIISRKAKVAAKKENAAKVLPGNVKPSRASAGKNIVSQFSAQLKHLSGEKRLVIELVICIFLAVILLAILFNLNSGSKDGEGRVAVSDEQNAEELVPVYPIKPKSDKNVKDDDVIKKRTPLSLRSISERESAFFNNVRKISGHINVSDVKQLCRLKAGVDEVSEEYSEIKSIVKVFLRENHLVELVNDGACDILLSFSGEGNNIKLVVRNNLFGNESENLLSEIVSVSPIEKLLSKLEVILQMNYCANMLKMLDSFNSSHDGINIKTEIVNVSDRGMNSIQGQSVNNGSKRQFFTGDRVNLCLTPQSRSYCMLFNISLDGIYMLFPRYGKDRNLLASEETQCSGTTEVTPPTGNEMLFALACKEEFMQPVQNIDFNQSMPYAQWSYGAAGLKGAELFCENLILNILNTKEVGWWTKSIFVKTSK